MPVTSVDYQGFMAKPGCPECGSTEVIPIVYGMPGLDLMQAADRGEVALGGCVIVEGFDPTHSCRVCGHEFQPPARAQR